MATPKKTQQNETSEQTASGADEHLIAMRKGGETLDVHPSCVDAHKAAGWVEG